MKLSEGKLFTIEALNRIEGFEWPGWASFAFMPKDSKGVVICKSQPVFNDFMNMLPQILEHQDAKVAHPDWWNSVIAREEFESVGGWVRNATLKLPPELIDSQIEVMHHNGEIAFDDANAFYWDENVDKWRYAKPQKQEVKSEPESIETMIRRYKDAGENKRAAIDKLNQAQADVEQAEALEDSLLIAIEAWAESHGFDIRQLDEVKK